MKTFLLVILALIAVVVALAVVIWVALKLIRLSSNWDDELDHPWPAETPVEVRLNLDSTMDNWILQVRKKKNFRLLKNYGWKDVLLYYPWCNRPAWCQNFGEYTWNKITWPVGINQFYEDRTLKSMIRTYGDLDGYYGLTQGYKEYMKQTFNEE